MEQFSKNYYSISVDPEHVNSAFPQPVSEWVRHCN
uniref:Uncharacterized protein n=1 Tax=Rhizophora mucronata TaxID=61149 RepID=A0A2P2P3Y9_RHIMU